MIIIDGILNKQKQFLSLRSSTFFSKGGLEKTKTGT